MRPSPAPAPPPPAIALCQHVNQPVVRPACTRLAPPALSPSAMWAVAGPGQNSGMSGRGSPLLSRSRGRVHWLPGAPWYAVVALCVPTLLLRFGLCRRTTESSVPICIRDGHPTQAPHRQDCLTRYKRRRDTPHQPCWSQFRAPEAVAAVVLEPHALQHSRSLALRPALQQGWSRCGRRRSGAAWPRPGGAPRPQP